MCGHVLRKLNVLKGSHPRTGLRRDPAPKPQTLALENSDTTAANGRGTQLPRVDSRALDTHEGALDQLIPPTEDDQSGPDKQ